MIIISGLLAAALVAVVVVLTRSHRASESAWTVERRELVNRVQAPQLIPRSAPAEFAAPVPEKDDSFLVGHVEYGSVEED